jgi:hypothetical protein
VTVLIWQRLCDVDPAPLVAWLEGDVSWQQNPNGIARVWEIPRHLTGAIVAAVLPHVPGAGHVLDLCLNRIEPGWAHGMHADSARYAGWLTRVHVPLRTNPGAWHLFEVESVRVHFEVGGAYSFDTEARHDFGNDGDSPRVHLVFDVYRG